MEKLQHPHVVRVLDLFEDDTNIYVALEMLPHGNLTEVLAQLARREIPIGEREYANLVRQILLAVKYIH